MTRYLGLFTLLILFTSAVYGQTCTEILQTAQRNFDDGVLEEIPSLISGCMEDGFTKEEKTNAYKLLIETYIYSNDILNADKVMLDFLSEFPSYTPSESDPKEFVDLYNSYDTDPVVNFEFGAGFLMSIPVITQNNSPVSTLTDPEEYYMGPGFSIEMNFLKDFNHNFRLAAGVSFLYSSMGYWSEPYPFTVLEATLWDMIIGVPVTARYNYVVSPMFELEFKLGIEPSFLLQHRLDFTRTDEGKEQPFTGVEILTASHRRVDLRPLVGIGATLDIGRDYISASINYRSGILKTLKEQDVYMDLDFSDKYLYHEDQMLSNHVNFNIAYVRPIYNPQKRQEQ